MQITEKQHLNFWSKVDKQAKNDCWLFTGCKNEKGYGLYRINNKNWKAHRFSYLLTHGYIPKDLEICHNCHIRNCVNPAHLEAATHQENCQQSIRDGRWKSRRRVFDEEVKLIKILYKQHKSYRKVGKLLKRDHKTIAYIIKGRWG